MPTIYSKRHPRVPTGHVVLKIGVMNLNGRIYERDVAEEGLRRYLASNQPFGMFMDDVNGITIDLNNVTHRTDRIWIKGDEMLAEITPMNTPKGKVLSQLMAFGLVEFRTSGFTPGVDPSGYVRDWTLISINAVSKGQGS